jgi:predicted ATP-grasp superfamily ATP-dependent carboligase
LAGHDIEVCDPDPFCIGRFSRFVRRFHRCPGLGTDPAGYLAFVLDLLEAEKFDVLLPTHEQGYLFAKVRSRLPPSTGIALPSFGSYAAAHGKAGFSRLLTELGLPQPHTVIVSSAGELRRQTIFPAVIKATIGTASRGVRFVRDAGDLERVIGDFIEADEFSGEVVTQALVPGPLERAQAVFDLGRLIASHAYRQIAEGVGGGDKIKESVERPVVDAHLQQIGERLTWHGALSVDYLLREPGNTPLYIDCNPRLVEPVNALRSGVDLAAALVAVSLRMQPEKMPSSRAGVRTHMAIQGLMRCAVETGARSALLSEAWHLWRGGAEYAGSSEELTPVGLDPWSLVPLSYVTLRMLASPSSAARLARQSARSHQLNPAAAKTIRDWIDPVGV